MRKTDKLVKSILDYEKRTSYLVTCEMQTTKEDLLITGLYISDTLTAECIDTFDTLKESEQTRLKSFLSC